MSKYANLNVPLFALLTVLLAAGTQCREWTPEQYPDPTKNYQECGNLASTHFCDPEKLVKGKDEIIHRLRQFTQNSAETGSNAHRCWREGVEVYFVVLDRVQKNAGESEAAATQRFAEALARKYNPDSSGCGRYIVTVMPISDRQVYSAKGKGVGLTPQQFTEAATSQRGNLQSGDHKAAILGMIASYERQITRLGKGGGAPTTGTGGTGGSGTSGTSGGKSSAPDIGKHLKGIKPWMWAVLAVIVIVLLCCCCCAFMCCKGKLGAGGGGSGGQGGIPMQNMGGGGGGGGGGFMSRLGGMGSGMMGGMMANQGMNAIRGAFGNRGGGGGGGGAPPPAYAGGGGGGGPDPSKAPDFGTTGGGGGWSASAGGTNAARGGGGGGGGAGW